MMGGAKAAKRSPLAISFSQIILPSYEFKKLSYEYQTLLSHVSNYRNLSDSSRIWFSTLAYLADVRRRGRRDNICMRGGGRNRHYLYLLALEEWMLDGVFSRQSLACVHHKKFGDLKE